MSFELDTERGGIPPIVADLVQNFFFDKRIARYGPFEPYEDGVEVLKDTLYEFPVFDLIDHGDYLLHIYLGICGIGGKFWDQEVRTLMRVGSMGHPALPRVIQGGYEECGDGGDFAFIITARPEATLRDPGEMEYYRNNKIESLWQLGTLADALTTLHMNGIQHRNLWHGTVERFKPSTGGRARGLRFIRFEMSAFFSNLFRRVKGSDSEMGRGESRGAVEHHI